MLPIFPTTEKRSQDAFMRLFFAARKRSAPILAELRVTHQMDGDKSFYERASGDRIQMEHQAMQVSWESKIQNGVGLTPEEFMDLADRAGEELATKEMEYFLQTMEDVTESVGNVVDCGGSDFSFELYVDLLKKTDIAFLDSGTPAPRTILASPSASAQIQRSLKEWELDESKQNILKEIYTQKLQIHNEREANRRVVD